MTTATITLNPKSTKVSYKTKEGFDFEFSANTWLSPSISALTEDVQAFVNDLPATAYRYVDVEVTATSEMSFGLQGQTQTIRTHGHLIVVTGVEFLDDKVLVEARLRFS